MAIVAEYRANIRWLAVANAVVGVVPCILCIDVASMARAADLSALDRRVHIPPLFKSLI